MADAWASPARDGFGSARCSVRAGQEVVAHAHGTFGVLPPPRDRTLPPLPWEFATPPPVPSVRDSELTEDEEKAVLTARSAALRAEVNGTTVTHELLAFEWQPSPAERSRGDLAIGPALTNRVGHLQGGFLYAAAALVAQHAAGESDWSVLDGFYQFLVPADGRLLSGHGQLQRKGRSTAFARVELTVDGQLIGCGLFTLRKAPSRHGPT